MRMFDPATGGEVTSQGVRPPFTSAPYQPSDPPFRRNPLGTCASRGSGGAGRHR
jgi:hypothetical protein